MILSAGEPNSCPRAEKSLKTDPCSVLNSRNPSCSYSSGTSCFSCSQPTQDIYIDCTDCTAQLCIECFRRGKESKEHRSFHQYCIVRTNLPVLEASWTSVDEKLLLDLVVECGYGNWESIAKLLPGKTQKQIQEHFNKYYLQGEDSILIPKYQEDRTFLVPSPTPFPAVGPLENPPRPVRKLGIVKDLADYNPARGEFGVEYDNNAERDVSPALNLQLYQHSSSDDNDLDVELQLAMVDIYQRRLQKRGKVRKLVRDYGLIARRKVFTNSLRYKNVKCWSGGGSGELTVFSQLLEPYQMDFILEGLLLEANTKFKILKLQKLREQGLKMLGSAQVLDNLLQVREEHVRQLSTNCIPGDSEPALISKLIPPGNLCDWRLNNPTLSSGSQISSQPWFKGTNTSRRSSIPLDILGLDGYERLTEEERTLCISIRLIPATYLEVKSLLERESTRRKGLRLADARQLVKIDVNKTRKIYDFLIEQGLIEQSSS